MQLVWLAYLIACSGGALSADALPRMPDPAGPFGIGRVGYDWIDSSQPDRYSPDPRAHRELMVYIWYPTTQKSADARGAYLPGAQQMDALPDIQKRMRRAFAGNWPAILSGSIFSHAVERAPLAKNPGRFPVIVFSHGLGSTGFNYTSLIEDLVSYGYVVAAIEHTYVAKAVWFPDGRVAEMQDHFVTINEGAADVRFVLERLADLNRDRNSGSRASPNLFGGRLDLTRVAAMGHSAGAEYAARACQLEPRFKACVDLDGAMVPVAALPVDPDGAKLTQPLLFLEADHPESQMGGTHAQNEAYFRKKEEQLQSCPPGSYDVIVKSPGIAHPSFSDIPLLFAGQNEFPETKVVLHNLALIETFIRSFLDKNLRQEAAPLLDGNAPHREATIQPYGH